MCWRAFQPEDIEDRDVQSMSSAGNNNVQAQIEMPRLSALESMSVQIISREHHVLDGASGTSAVDQWSDAMLCITPCCKSALEKEAKFVEGVA